MNKAELHSCFMAEVDQLCEVVLHSVIHVTFKAQFVVGMAVAHGSTAHLCSVDADVKRD